ncbi:Poly(ADP-ribose) polymerase catalytic domain protein, partial [Cooperia oncophora]
MGRGEYQTTPFSTLDAAMKEFKSVWRSKTGQDWGPFSQFQVLPKKYRLVQQSVTRLKIDRLFLRTKVRSAPFKKLTVNDEGVRWIDPCHVHLVTLARQQLKGHAVYLMIAKRTWMSWKKSWPRENHTDTDVLKVFETSRSLSGEFYNTFPIADFEYGAVKIFDNKDDINRAREDLNRMTEVEVATRLLTAAAHRKDVDRISYIMSALECRFTEMSPAADMSQKILRYIHVTGGACWKVKGILEITPREAVLNFGDFADDENQMFLWHGTKAVNLISILKDGFLVNPRNTSITGRLFGDGIYLADSFEKSTHYCQSSANGYNYMLLCRVALGKCHKINSWNCSWGEEMPKGYDSLHVVGQKHPLSSITEN